VKLNANPTGFKLVASLTAFYRQITGKFKRVTFVTLQNGIDNQVPRTGIEPALPCDNQILS